MKARALYFAVALFMVSAVAGASSAFAIPPLPEYDAGAEVVLVGQVHEIRARPGASEVEVRIVVTTAAGAVDVHVGSLKNVKGIDLGFKTGDDIEVTGSKVTYRGNAIVLAREIVKGQSAYVLRDARGAPVWMKQHRDLAHR